MREIIGRHEESDAFEAFLADWRAILADRVQVAIDALAAVDGVYGLILAGSNGAGHPWPLSDIDLIPVIGHARVETVTAAIEATRQTLRTGWPGWPTGVDSGRLWIGTDELATFVPGMNPDPVPYLREFRWYHIIDKAFGGQAVVDPDGSLRQVVDWVTRHRFDPGVVGARLDHERDESRESFSLAQDHWTSGTRAGAWASLLKAVQWLVIYHLECWGLRDNSLGRLGTRFERAATEHGMHHLAVVLNEISRLDEHSLSMRWELAPDWCSDRRDRSWQARLAVDSCVTALQNDQDAMRVCTLYGLRAIDEEADTRWLAVPEDDDAWTLLASRFRAVMDRLLSEA